MPTWAWILVVIVAVVILMAIAWSRMRAERTKGLQKTFGPEYDRAVEDRPQSEAEAELIERRARREKLEVRPLTDGARARYRDEWTSTQSEFVDSPERAITDADMLIQRVMRERGYPVEDFDQRVADVSVDHPVVVENYREAHRISSASRRGEASTEDLRTAMKHYRALFEDLLETGPVRDEARR